jgi:uncharacterized glyoxalase superfamily protein PhnB
MLISRTTGPASVVPELVYSDVGAAVDWLCAAFGFSELWRAGEHRARVASGNGAVIVANADAQYGRVAPGRAGPHSHAVMVKVDNVDAHYEQARQSGARIVSAPADYPYGERQYTAEDLAGHRWTFTQTIADLAPEDWGGTSKTLPSGRAAAGAGGADARDDHQDDPGGRGRAGDLPEHEQPGH